MSTNSWMFGLSAFFNCYMRLPCMQLMITFEDERSCNQFILLQICSICLRLTDPNRQNPTYTIHTYVVVPQHCRSPCMHTHILCQYILIGPACVRVQISGIVIRESSLSMCSPYAHTCVFTASSHCAVSNSVWSWCYARQELPT